MILGIYRLEMFEVKALCEAKRWWQDTNLAMGWLGQVRAPFLSAIGTSRSTIVGTELVKKEGSELPEVVDEPSLEDSGWSCIIVDKSKTY